MSALGKTGHNPLALVCRICTESSHVESKSSDILITQLVWSAWSIDESEERGFADNR